MLNLGWNSGARLSSWVLHFLGSLWNIYILLSYPTFFIEIGRVTKCWGLCFVMVFVFITYKDCSSKPVCLALLAISFLDIKWIFFFFFFYQENRSSLLWIMLSCIYVFWRYQLELWQKALEENLTVYLGQVVRMPTLLYCLSTSWVTW